MIHETEFSQMTPELRGRLLARTLAGEVFVLRGALHRNRWLEALSDTTLEGVEEYMGQDTAARLREVGFERLHEIIPIEDLPGAADAVYRAHRATFTRILGPLVRTIFDDPPSFYHEPSPHVRFHIPYYLARRQQSGFDRFAKKYGQGKLSAHGPHRDSWLDCPSNSVNLWAALGGVRRGNGLAIFDKDYGKTFSHQPSGDISITESLRPPTTFELAPGDLILFHGDQMHGSELNRTRETRFVISFRITFGRPRFAFGHYHAYHHHRLYESRLKAVSHVPANLQSSYARSLVTRVGAKLGLAKPPNCQTVESRPVSGPDELPANVRLDAAELPVGKILPLSRKLCVARTAEGEAFAFSRRCPHKGADLATGWLEGQEVICPWHNLPFDLRTGASPCLGLGLRRVACHVEDGVVTVEPKALRRAVRSPAGGPSPSVASADPARPAASIGDEAPARVELETTRAVVPPAGPTPAGEGKG